MDCKPESDAAAHDTCIGALTLKNNITYTVNPLGNLPPMPHQSQMERLTNNSAAGLI